jgi:hypothetical protein
MLYIPHTGKCKDAKFANDGQNGTLNLASFPCHKTEAGGIPYPACAVHDPWSVSQLLTADITSDF